MIGLMGKWIFLGKVLENSNYISTVGDQNILITVINHAARGKMWVHGLVKMSVGLAHLSYNLLEEQAGKLIF